MIISTRAEADAAEDCRMLKDRGYRCYAAPASRIVWLKFEFDAESYQAMILTSRHAAAALENHPAVKKPCFAIGPATAEAARQSGFTDITEASGSGEALVALVRKSSFGRFAWVAGHDIAYDVKQHLESAGGHVVERVVAYQALPQDRLDDEVVEAIKEATDVVAMIYSEQSGARFRKVLEKHGLAEATRKITLISISAAATRLCKGEWRNIHIADAPIRESMLSLAATVEDGFSDRLK